MSQHGGFTLSSKRDPKGTLEALNALKRDLATKRWWVKSREQTSLTECRQFADHSENNISVEDNKGHIVSYLKAFVNSGHVRVDMQAHVLGKVPPLVGSSAKKYERVVLSRQNPALSRTNKKSVSAPYATVVVTGDVKEEKILSEGDANVLSEKALAVRNFTQAYKPQEPTDAETMKMILEVQPDFSEPLSLSIIKDASPTKESVLQSNTKQPCLDANADRSVSALECCFSENNFTLPERADRNEYEWKALLWNVLAVHGFIYGVKVSKETTLLPEFRNLTERVCDEDRKPSLFVDTK